MVRVARDLLRYVLLVPRNLGITLLLVYRRVVSPWYGDVCRYHPTCSEYALNAVQQRGLVVGVGMAAWRLMRCNPWSLGGVDRVTTALRPWYVVYRSGWVGVLSSRITRRRATGNGKGQPSWT